MKNKKQNQKEVYEIIKRTMIERGFQKDNTTVLTLLLPLNDLSNHSQLMRKVRRLFRDHELDIITVIEPVIEPKGSSPFRPKYYSSRYYHNINKFLPMYHAHVIVRAAPEEICQMKSEWSRIVKSKRDELFRCEPIKKSIPELVNYVTKYWEEKRNLTADFSIELNAPAQVVAVDDQFEEELQRNEIEDSMLKRVLGIILQPIKKLFKAYLNLFQAMSDKEFSDREIVPFMRDKRRY
jgi:hypothetical protein